jgi:hypothetical protein
MADITTIYLDMDGVIADFSKRYKELFGIDPSEADNYKTFEKFFLQFIAQEQFSTLELMPDAFKLIDYLKSLDITTKILSSTSSESKDEAIRGQKFKWLETHNITFEPILVPGKRFKRQYATPSSILIDDTESNINQWHEDGGVAILHTNIDDTINRLKAYL